MCTRYRFWELKTQSNSATMPSTRAMKREQIQQTQRPEPTMNQITVESNVVETEATELQALAIQTADAMLELNAAQLMLVGGGSTIILTD